MMETRRLMVSDLTTEVFPLPGGPNSMTAHFFFIFAPGVQFFACSQAKLPDRERCQSETRQEANNIGNRRDE
jgi:hypothetical protein